ncbi:hypothetical protein Tco_1259711 [Tanacetum coccineum]
MNLAINKIKRREGDSVQAFITRYTKKISQITRLNEDQRIAGFVHGVKIKSLVKFISTELLEGYNGPMDQVYSCLQVEEPTSKGRPVTFMDGVAGEKPQKGRPWEGVGRKNKERGDKELKNQIEEAVKSRKLAHLVKGIRKRKAKHADTQLRGWVTLTVKAEPTTNEKEKPIPMIRIVNNPLKTTPKNHEHRGNNISPNLKQNPSVDPILISVQVQGRQVGRVLLDGGPACDIIYEHCFLKFQKEIREKRKDVYTTLSGFFGMQVTPLGEISLQIIVREAPHHRNERITFLIVQSESPNNMLFGRTSITELGMIPSTMHFAVLYQSEIGPRVIMSENQDMSKRKEKRDGSRVKRSSDKRGGGAKKAGILRETRYQTWVANTVMVKKSDRVCRMCVNFKDINKACPKDCYSLSEIDWKVDLLLGRL